MATPVSKSVPLSGNWQIDGLIQGNSWSFGTGGRVITYSLSLNDNPRGGSWTDDLANGFRAAPEAWSNVANLTFLEVSSGASGHSTHPLRGRVKSRIGGPVPLTCAQR